MEAAAAKQRSMKMSENDVFPAPYAARSTGIKIISKSNGNSTVMGLPAEVRTYAKVQYYYGEGISRFQDCLNAWTDIQAVNVMGSITGDPRDFTFEIIDSSRTLAVTTYTYITVTADAGVTPPITGTTTMTQYTEFGYDLL